MVVSMLSYTFCSVSCMLANLICSVDLLPIGLHIIPPDSHRITKSLANFMTKFCSSKFCDIANVNVANKFPMRNERGHM